MTNLTGTAAIERSRFMNKYGRLLMEFTPAENIFIQISTYLGNYYQYTRTCMLDPVTCDNIFSYSFKDISKERYEDLLKWFDEGGEAE